MQYLAFTAMSDSETSISLDINNRLEANATDFDILNIDLPRSAKSHTWLSVRSGNLFLHSLDSIWI